MYKHSNSRERRAIRHKEKGIRMFFVVLIIAFEITAQLNFMENFYLTEHLEWLKSYDDEGTSTIRDFVLIGLTILTYSVLSIALYKFYYFDFILSYKMMFLFFLTELSTYLLGAL
jgi:hypothetical protein